MKTHLSWCLLILLGLLLTSEALGQRRFVNESGRLFALTKLVDSKGVPFVRLYMSGHEMVVDAEGNPTKGA